MDFLLLLPRMDARRLVPSLGNRKFLPSDFSERGSDYASGNPYASTAAVADVIRFKPRWPALSITSTR